LRSVPLVIAVEMAKAGFGSALIEETAYRVIQRADELSEILAYYSQANNRTGTKKLNKLHNGLKRGIAKAFRKFDEYQFAKYNRDGEIKLRDVMFLTHPNPRGVDGENLYYKIANNLLEIPDTWEVALSKNDGRTKKEKWEELVENKSLGYMALLRNLRNMLEVGVVMHPVLAQLTNRDAILKSRQFPFRYLSAYEAIKEVADFSVRDVMEALDFAITTSISNIKGFDNQKVFIACDVSGSMQGKMSDYGSIKTADIGLILGMLLQYKSDKVMTGVFADRFQIVNTPKSSILANIESLQRATYNVGGSTNGWTVIDYLIKNKVMADKVMIFTDCQMWDSDNTWGYVDSKSFRQYWATYQRMNPAAKLYIFDLAGYGTMPVDLSTPNVYQISGWSEKIFNMLDALEHGSTNLKEIEKIEIGG